MIRPGESIRVVALTSGVDVPSTRFRIRQYVPALRELGVVVDERLPLVDKFASPPFPAARPLLRAAKVLSRLPLVFAARRGDVVWLERDMIAGRYTYERFLPERTVMDVDDALWAMGKPGYSERIAKRCRGVIAGNDTIASHYKGLTPNVWIVPTSIDTSLWKPDPARKRPAPFTIGWIGTSFNLGYVREIEEPLFEVLDRHREARLLIVADKPPVLTRIPPDRWVFERWSAASEQEAVRKMDVGIMPLPDIGWAWGKCGAKMIQYMALGVPVVVSPIGSGAEILAAGEVGLPARTLREWSESLCTILENPELARRLGAEGRRLVERSYSVETNAPRLARIFAEVATSSTS